MSKAAEIAYLINKYLFYKLSEEEEIVLEEWRNLSEKNEALFLKLTDKSRLDDKLEKFRKLYPNTVWEKTRNRINIDSGYDIDLEPQLMIIPPKTIRWLIIGVIILALIGISSGLYLVFTLSKQP